MSDPEPPVSKPWKWPGEWVRDQGWWRDVSTRAAAGLIVVFIAWGVGVAVGAFSDPGVVAGFFNVLLAVMAIVCAFTLFYEIRVIIRHFQGRPKSRRSATAETMPLWVFLGQIIGTMALLTVFILELHNRIILGNDYSIIWAPFL